jgi:membrane fusion protein (multidrug efflux system)
VDAVRGGRAPERAELAARAAEARAAAAFARTEARRVAALHDQRQVSDEERQRAEAEAARLEAAADAARRALERGGWDRSREEHEREAEAGALAHDVAAARGRLAAAAATIARLEQARDDRRVRASVAGVLDDVAPLHPGAVVKPADRLATIVPDGPLRVVARFTPVALGRLAAGQAAVVRLQGFPWTQYGVLRASVDRVAGEVRDGRVRVELAPVDPAQFPAPLRHGLPGTVEVEVEKVAPATLVLRLAGRLLDRGEGQPRVPAE